MKLFIVAFFSISFCFTANAQTSEKPNILFIIADDIGRELFGVYGSTFVKTPNFDTLADEGILFNNAFTTNGKCSPSRASILTGRDFFQLEEGASHHKNRIFPNQFKTYQDVLASNGYHTGHTGKGYGIGQWEHSGRTVPPSGEEYIAVKYAEGYNDLVKGVDDYDPEDYEDIIIRPFGGFTEEMMKELIFTGNVRNTDYQSNFQVFLDNNDNDKPFCFWFGSREAHDPWLLGSGEKYLSDRTLSDVVVPPYYPDTEEIRRYFLDIALEVEMFDTQVGEAIATLKANNLYDNTIIVVTSDNGTSGMRNKGDMYPINLNMPLLVHYPKEYSARTTDEIINFSDLAPTFLDLAGAPIPTTMTGKSFKPLLENQSFKGGDIKYGGRETYDPNTYPSRSVLSGDFYYIRNFYYDKRYPRGSTTPPVKAPIHTVLGQILDQKNNYNNNSFYEWCAEKRPYEELYNIKEDPFCLNNLAEEAAYQDKRKEYALLLDTNLKDLNDPRILQDQKMITLWDTNTIVEESLIFKASFNTEGAFIDSGLIPSFVNTNIDGETLGSIVIDETPSDYDFSQLIFTNPDFITISQNGNSNKFSVFVNRDMSSNLDTYKITVSVPESETVYLLDRDFTFHLIDEVASTNIFPVVTPELAVYSNESPSVLGYSKGSKSGDVLGTLTLDTSDEYTILGFESSLDFVYEATVDANIWTIKAKRDLNLSIEEKTIHKVYFKRASDLEVSGNFEVYLIEVPLVTVVFEENMGYLEESEIYYNENAVEDDLLSTLTINSYPLFDVEITKITSSSSKNFIFTATSDPKVWKVNAKRNLSLPSNYDNKPHNISYSVNDVEMPNSFVLLGNIYSPSPLSLNDYDKNNGIKIYPIPVNDVLNIVGHGEKEIIIYTLIGTKVLEQTTTSNKINLESLSHGVYMVAIRIGDSSYILKKIVKN